MSYVHDLEAILANHADETIAISNRIWEYAEPRFEEYRSSKEIADYLETQGFEITWNLGDAETAFVAQYGAGKPVIAFLGEYDSLNGLSQLADCNAHAPLDTADGHGCGHNLLGAGAMAAAVAIKEYMTEKGLPGTIRFYGCPAEENAGGKAFMVKSGCFDDCDIALTWHPSWTNKVVHTGSLANVRVFFTFHGISAHAAGSPHLGRSALDAVELMNVGVNYMREHMIDDARIHYAVTNTGGTAPNVVQSEAQVLYAIRAPKVSQVKELFDRVCKVAQGAALMTETEVDIKQVAAYADYIASEPILERMRVHMDAALPLEYTEEELAYAAKFRSVITELDEKGLKEDAKKCAKLCDDDLNTAPIWNFRAPDSAMGGSTDVGDVSWVCPTAQFYATTKAAGTAAHSWQTTAQGKSSIAHKGMLLAAKILAATAYDFLTDPALVTKAREDWLASLDGETYPGLLPKDAKPEIW